MTMTDYHIPVMLHECVEALNMTSDGYFVDATFGGGGHSKEILKHLETGKLIGFDQDNQATRNLPDDENLIFVNHNFQYFKNFLKYYEMFPCDGILADLGVSSHQIDTADRGFSFRFDADLDMRMDQGQKQSAKEIIANYTEQELARIFHLYGEFKRSRQVARAIVQARSLSPIYTTNQLKSVVEPFLDKKHHNKGLAQIFQALRIEVNEEMAVLTTFLRETVSALKPGGRLVVLTYHSLEDRLVKNLIQKGNIEGKPEQDFYGNVIRPFTPINRKPLLATDEEMERNPRARSAKLRIAVRNEDELINPAK